MTSCTALSDRMPEVALGRSRWTEQEERHLAECSDCRAEWAVVRAAQRLGTSLPEPADPSVMAARLGERLARERALSRRRMRFLVAAGLAAAAVLALVVWPGAGGLKGPARHPAPVALVPVPVRSPADSSALVGPHASAGVELPLPELDSLPAEALDSMLRVLDEPLARADADDAPLGDQGDQELEHALSGLEG